ncbi:MAG: FAD-dependent oxidoreductase, partial [Acidobacteriota bacterium]
LQFLEAVSKDADVALGRRVVVIGGGNAAIDSARSALRKGSQATVVYRRERKDMPAIVEETDAAEAEGAEYVFLATPHRIIGDRDGRVKALEAVRTRLGEFDSSGRRKPISTEEIVRVDCDTVILAVGETVDPDFGRATGLKTGKSNVIEVDRYTLETSRSKFYAGGDAISGASNVSNAMGYGKKAARLIDERLMGVRRFEDLWPDFDYDQEPPEHTSDCRRHHVKEIPAAIRVNNFEEAVCGFPPPDALAEAGRCLRCDIKKGD